MKNLFSFLHNGVQGAGEAFFYIHVLSFCSVNNIPGIEEVNMIKDDGTVIHFNNPKVQASLAANTFAVTGHAENKRKSDWVRISFVFASGSVGSVCFWASWIRIHKSEAWIWILLSPSKNSEKNLDSYCL
jgi:hypothetical protein